MSVPSSEQILARLDRQTREAVERAQQATEFRQSVDQLRGTAEVSGVVATVDVTGALVGLELPRFLAHEDPQRLAARVLEATRAAHAQASARAEELASDTFGAESGTTQHFRTELEARAKVLRGEEGRA